MKSRLFRRHTPRTTSTARRPFLESLETRTLLTALVVTNANDSGAGSLRAAIAASANNDTIGFDPSLAGSTITLTSAINITTNLIISGSGAQTVQISGNNAVNIFNINDGLNDTIDNLSFFNGLSPDAGGAIRVLGITGRLSVNNCLIDHCVATTGGGGVGYVRASTFTPGGTLILVNDTFSHNTANDSISVGILDGGHGRGGGAVNTGGVNTTLTGGSIQNNSTLGGVSGSNEAEGGGGINTEGGTLTVTNCTIDDNSTAGFAGGAVETEGGAFTATNSHFDNNTADGTGGGGGIMTEGGTFSLTFCSVNSNTASNNTAGLNEGGGGINSEGGAITIIRSNITSNTADGPLGGGGILSEGAPVTISDSTISENSADSSAGNAEGGGAINSEGGAVTLTNVTIDDNSSDVSVNKGGIAFGTGHLTILNTIVSRSTGPNFSGTGTFTSLGHNISSDASAVSSLTAAGDLNSTDPKLGPLTNIGSFNFIEQPLTGSPAIGTGTTVGVTSTLDQIGNFRITNGLINIGAVETTGTESPNQCLIEIAYTDLLGRSADAPGLAYWLNLLNTGTSKDTVMFYFTHTPEYLGRLVDASYNQVLHHNPDPTGRTFWINALSIPSTLTSDDLKIALFSTAEYATFHPTNDNFVTGVFSDLLAHNPDPTGLAFYSGLLTNGTSRGAVAAAILNSHEYNLKLVDTAYTSLLQRAADPTGETFWNNLLDTKTITHDQLPALFAASPEYSTTAITRCAT